MFYEIPHHVSQELPVATHLWNGNPARMVLAYPPRKESMLRAEIQMLSVFQLIMHVVPGPALVNVYPLLKRLWPFKIVKMPTAMQSPRPPLP